MLFLLMMVAPILVALSMSRGAFRWNAQAIEQRRWLLTSKIIPWEEVTEANLQMAHGFRFRGAGKQIRVDPNASGARQLARYARCRLKKNPRVVWSV